MNETWRLCVAVFLVFLVIMSGVFLWAIGIGVAVFGLAFGISRKVKIALDTGGAAAAFVSIFGIVAMFVPGWYKDLL